MDRVVAYVSRCVQNASENLGLEALEDLDSGIGGCPTYLNSLGTITYGFQYCFI
jgi:hypothetical protein